MRAMLPRRCQHCAIPLAGDPPAPPAETRPCSVSACPYDDPRGDRKALAAAGLRQGKYDGDIERKCPALDWLRPGYVAPALVARLRDILGRAGAEGCGFSNDALGELLGASARVVSIAISHEVAAGRIAREGAGRARLLRLAANAVRDEATA